MAFSVVYFCTALISMVVQIEINAPVLILVVLVNKTNKQTNKNKADKPKLHTMLTQSFKAPSLHSYCACASRDVTGFEKSRK